MQDTARRAVLLAAAFLCGGRATADTLALPGGPHAVGFAVLTNVDGTRRLPDGSPRPLQVTIWYPAQAATASTPMRYRDYVLVSARERSSTPLGAAEESAALARYRGFLASNGVPEAAVDAWLDAPMTAVFGAPRARGRFPLVAIATGNGGAVQDEAALGEFLASRGYVALTTPSPMRLGAPLQSDADVLPRAEEQATDLSQALALVRKFENVERTRLGLVGYSFGARAALLLAAREKDVRALASLDGGIASAEARDWLPPGFARRGFRKPLLHVYGESADFGLLDTLTRADRWLVKVAGLRHLDLITYGLAAAMLPPMAAEGPAELRQRLQAMCEYLAAFLDAHVAGRAPWAAWLSVPPKAHGFPDGLVTVTLMPVKGGPP